MPRNTQKLLTVERTYGMWKVAQPLRLTRYYFGTERKPYRSLSKRQYNEARGLQAHKAVKVHTHNGTTWWWFQKQVYVERDKTTSRPRT